MTMALKHLQFLKDGRRTGAISGINGDVDPPCVPLTTALGDDFQQLELAIGQFNAIHGASRGSRRTSCSGEDSVRAAAASAVASGAWWQTPCQACSSRICRPMPTLGLSSLSTGITTNWFTSARQSGGAASSCDELGGRVVQVRAGQCIPALNVAERNVAHMAEEPANALSA